MATVRISKELKNSVLTRIRRLNKQKLDATINRIRLTNQEFVDFYADLLTPMEDGLKAIHPAFLKFVKDFTLRAEGVHASTHYNLDTPMVFFADAYEDDRFRLDSGMFQRPIVLKHVPENEDVINRLKAIDELRDKDRIETSEALGMVEQLLKTYTTLKPALKAWPPLWELLDDEYKERHLREATKRSKADTTSPDISDSEAVKKLTAAISMNRINGGV